MRSVLAHVPVALLGGREGDLDREPRATLLIRKLIPCSAHRLRALATTHQVQRDPLLRTTSVNVISFG